MTHRRVSQRQCTWSAAFAVVLAVAIFPAAAGAATPTPTPCPVPVTGSSPCYTAVPAITPANEVASPPEGRILTATTGTWSPAAPPVNLTYQWQDCDAATGLTCSDIGGQTSRTYKVASTDVGSRLQILVKATNSAGTGWAVVQAGTAAKAVPINRAAPTISGPANDGQTLTASTGNWDGTMPITGYTYQWDRCPAAGGITGCAKINGAASTTYTLTDLDLGHTVEVGVIATNSVGPSGAAPVFSRVTPVVTQGNTALPTIAGTAQQGKTLTETHGSWIPNRPDGYAYQWETCDASGAACSAIAGATSQTYTMTGSDVGHTVRVQESAISGVTTSSPADSAATGVVAGPPPVVTSGNPLVTSGNPPSGNNGGQNVGHGTGKVSTAQIRSLLLNALAVRGNGARLGALLKHGGYAFSFAAPSPGRLAITWYYTRKHGGKISVVNAAFTFHKKGAARIKLALTGKGRRLLSGASKVKLTAKGGFTPAGQGPTSASMPITLKA